MRMRAYTVIMVIVMYSCGKDGDKGADLNIPPHRAQISDTTFVGVVADLFVGSVLALGGV